MATLVLVTACSGDNQDVGASGGNAGSASASQTPVMTQESTPSASPVKVSEKKGDIAPLVKKDGKIKCGSGYADAKLLVHSSVPFHDSEVSVKRDGDVVALTVTPSNRSIDSGFINGKVPFVLDVDDSLLTATFYFDQKEVGEVESVTLCGKIPTNS